MIRSNRGFTALLALTLFAPAIASAIQPIGIEAKGQLDACSFLFDGPGNEIALTNWRSTFMHSNKESGATAPIAETSTAREQLIQSRIKSMINYIWVDKDIPDMEMIPAEGVKMVTLRAANYNTGATPIVEVSGVGASGLLRATLLLPVSGHCGWDSAATWSKTDQYKVWYKGKGMSGQGNLIAKDAQSLEFVTTHEIEIKLEKDQTVTIFYARNGSAGVGGFGSGRTIEIKWDGT